MNRDEFEQFVLENGKEILRFCRMTCQDKELGDELYQDTMLKLLGKRKQLDIQQNARSYALSIAILLCKNKRRKYANRNRLIFFDSIEGMNEDGGLEIMDYTAASPEDAILQDDEKKMVQTVVYKLPEKYRLPIILFYSADISFQEISKILNIPVGTVKSRMSKAKSLIKAELEVLGYDR